MHSYCTVHVLLERYTAATCITKRFPSVALYFTVQHPVHGCAAKLGTSATLVVIMHAQCMGLHKKYCMSLHAGIAVDHHIAK